MMRMTLKRDITTITVYLITRRSLRFAGTTRKPLPEIDFFIISAIGFYNYVNLPIGLHISMSGR